MKTNNELFEEYERKFKNFHNTIKIYQEREKEFSEAVSEFRKEWREKCRIMEIMSGEVAIFELEGLHKKHFGSFEKEKRK